MEKKAVIIGSIIVILAGAIFLVVWRSHVMGPGAHVSAGGLVAVSFNGTPMPIPAAYTGGGNIPENTAILESDGLLVSMTLNPYPPSASKTSTFEIKLTDAEGLAISDAIISVDLTMPGMYMPPNLLNLEPAGAGMYAATGRFTMRGPWRMEVIITLDGQTKSVFFDVWL
jgi:YtkA-like